MYLQTFRVQGREAQYIQYARLNRKMGVNQIGQVASRAESTIQHHVEYAEKSTMTQIDNRRYTPTSRTNGRISFLRIRAILSLGFKLYVAGLIQEIRDAFDPVMIAFFGKVVTEKSSDESDEDPA